VRTSAAGFDRSRIRRPSVAALQSHAIMPNRQTATLACVLLTVVVAQAAGASSVADAPVSLATSGYACTHCDFRAWDPPAMAVLHGSMKLLDVIGRDERFVAWFASRDDLETRGPHQGGKGTVARRVALDWWRHQLDTLGGAPAGAAYPRPSAKLRFTQPVLPRVRRWAAPTTNPETEKEPGTMRLPLSIAEAENGAPCLPDRRCIPASTLNTIAHELSHLLQGDDGYPAIQDAGEGAWRARAASYQLGNAFQCWLGASARHAGSADDEAVRAAATTCAKRVDQYGNAFDYSDQWIVLP
jgi:hypothetical protein